MYTNFYPKEQGAEVGFEPNLPSPCLSYDTRHIKVIVSTPTVELSKRVNMIRFSEVMQLKENKWKKSMRGIGVQV